MMASHDCEPSLIGLFLHVKLPPSETLWFTFENEFEGVFGLEGQKIMTLGGWQIEL